MTTPPDPGLTSFLTVIMIIENNNYQYYWYYCLLRILFLCDPQIVLNAVPLGHFPWLWGETEWHTWENQQWPPSTTLREPARADSSP